jgi:uncharacterized protein (TIGR02246 family)
MTREEALAVVQRQVDAYNARDLEAFVATYAPDATIADSSGVRGAGHDWIRSQYGPLFAGGSAPVEIRGRVAAGAWVVDEELVRRPHGDIHVLATYRLAGGAIAEVLFLTGPEVVDGG